MRLPSPVVAGSIAIAVFAGGFAIGHFVTDDSGSSPKASGKPQVLGEVFTNTTTTTAAISAPPTSQAPSPTTTPTTAPPAAKSQSVTVTPVPQTQAASSPPATTTVVVTNTACGSGTATAGVSSRTFPRSNTANTDYETDATATVKNGVDKPIQIDTLTIRLYYEDGTIQDVAFNGAVGNVVQPGVTSTYSVSLNTGQRPVHTTGLQTFSFHTAGHPECTGSNS